MEAIRYISRRNGATFAGSGGAKRNAAPIRVPVLEPWGPYRHSTSRDGEG